MEYQTEPVTMWFDRRLVMRPSPIHGIGTFATHPIRASERLIWVSGGIVYSSEDWRTGRVQLAPEQYNEAQIGDDLFIATPKSLYYYVNHSCAPNILNEVAWRDIQAGEEITTDYAYYYFVTLVVEAYTIGYDYDKPFATSAEHAAAHWQ